MSMNQRADYYLVETAIPDQLEARAGKVPL